MSEIYTKPYGGEGGIEFSPINITEKMAIGLRAGSKVDQIRIGGKKYGKKGGKDLGSIQLMQDEYINSVEVRAGAEIDKVKFTTNLGRSIGGGGQGGKEQEKLENIRVLAIGGRSGARVDKLEITYISNYKPSEPVEGEDNAAFILSYTPPFSKFTSYQDTKLNTLKSYETLSEQILSKNYKASVEGEYFAKMASSIEIDLKSTKLDKSIEEIRNEIKSGKTKEEIIKEGYVGIVLVSGTLMKSPDGDYWMYPKGKSQYSIIKTTETRAMLNTYDLTGLLYTQMQDLTDHKTSKYTFVYYAEK